MAQLRPAANHRRVAAASLDGKPQAGVSHAARRQSLVRAQAEVRRDNRLQPRTESLPEPGPRHGVTDVDQLWVADITYIRLQDEFVSLAVILDPCSLRVIGWASERTVEDELTLAARRVALALPSAL